MNYKNGKLTTKHLELTADNTEDNEGTIITIYDEENDD